MWPKNWVYWNFSKKIFENLKFSTWCASPKNFLIIFPESTGLNTLIENKFLRSKWTYEGVWVDSKVITIRIWKKIDDKSRDVHQINFLIQYSESASKKTPPYKFSAILNHIWKFQFFYRIFDIKISEKNEVSQIWLKIAGNL